MEHGDIIRLDYETWTLEPETLIETTDESLAKAEDIYDESRSYKPASVIVGEGHLIGGFDDALFDADVGEEKEITIEPKDAYGERDPKMVEIHSIREIQRLPDFRRRDLEPQVGMQITMKNRLGMITYMTASRVRVDFNHPFAGKTLRCKFTVRSKAETPEEVATAIIDIYYGSGDDFDIALSDDTMRIVTAERCKLDQKWLLKKLRIIADLTKNTDVDLIEFVERYETPKEEEEEGLGTEPPLPDLGGVEENEGDHGETEAEAESVPADIAVAEEEGVEEE